MCDNELGFAAKARQCENWRRACITAGSPFTNYVFVTYLFVLFHLNAPRRGALGPLPAAGSTVRSCLAGSAARRMIFAACGRHARQPAHCRCLLLASQHAPAQPRRRATVLIYHSSSSSTYIFYSVHNIRGRQARPRRERLRRRLLASALLPQ